MNRIIRKIYSTTFAAMLVGSALALTVSSSARASGGSASGGPVEQVITAQISGADGFMSWFHDKYYPFLHHGVMNKLYDLYQKHRQLKGFPANLPWYSLNSLKGDPDLVGKAYNSLEPYMQGYAKDTTIARAPNNQAYGMVRSYTLAEASAHYAWVLRLSANDVNLLKQHAPRALVKIYAFVETWNPAGLADFKTRLSNAEAWDDIRQLQGETENTVEEYKSLFSLKNHTLIPKYGTANATVERVELVNNAPYLLKLIGFHHYSQTNQTQHGLNTTELEPKTGHSYLRRGYQIPETYDIEKAQTDGVDYYANAHTIKYGAFPGLTEAQSTRALSDAGDRYLKTNGQPYPSYVLGREAVVTAGLLGVAIARWRLEEKKVDLEAFRVAGEQRVAGLLTQLNVDELAPMRKEVAITGAVLFAANTAAAIIGGLIINEAYENEKNTNATAIDAVKTVVKSAAALGTGYTVSIGAVGFYSMAALERYDVWAKYSQAYLGATFAANDIVLAVTSAATELRKEINQYKGLVKPSPEVTAASYARISGAFVRLSGGLYAATDFVLKSCTTTTHWVFSSIKPITFQKNAALLSATLYGVGLALGVADAVGNPLP